jgi:hypothetical protein
MLPTDPRKIARRKSSSFGSNDAIAESSGIINYCLRESIVLSAKPLRPRQPRVIDPAYFV